MSTLSWESFEQRSSEWYKMRLGLLSPSRFGDMMTRSKVGGDSFGLTALKYMDEKLAEMLTLESAEDGYVSSDMQRGMDLEPDAIAAYEKRTGFDVQQIGFIQYIKGVCGGSPDGLVGSDGMIECKCPRTKNHIHYIKTGVVTNKSYIYQMQGYMMMADREWCDFISYNPLMKHDALKLIVIRVDRDEEIITALKNRIRQCNGHIVNLYNKILFAHGIL